MFGLRHAETINITEPDSPLITGEKLTINDGRQQVFSVTALKIAFPPRRPEESDQAVDHPPLDELVLLLGLDTDQVHAVSPADVPASDPVHLEVLGEVVLPGEEVVVSLVLGVFDPVGAVPGVGQTQGARPVTETLGESPGESCEDCEEEFHLWKERREMSDL